MLTRVRLVGAVLAMIGVCATGAAQGTDKTDHEIKSATLSRIFAAWKAREERIKSFHVSWDSRIILPKSVPRPVGPLLAGLETRNNGSGGEKLEYTLPGSELWGEAPNRLRDDFLVVRNTGENAWERISRVRNVVDGASHFRLMVPLISSDFAMATVWREFEAKNAEAVPAALRARPEFSGAIGELGPHWRAREIDLLPLLLAFRPSNPLCAIASLPWRVMSENAIVEQVHCVKLQAIPNSDDNRPHRFSRFNSPAYNSDTCWVDPSRDYVVVFWESKRPGQPDISVAIDYRHDPLHGWVPSQWRRHLASRRSGIAGTVDATVSRCAVNEALPAGTFARDFPAGTQICDVTVDEQVGAKLATESASPIPKRDATRDAIVAAWTRQRSRIRSYRIAWEPEWIRPYRVVPDFSAEKDRAQKKEGAKKAVIHPEFQKFKSLNKLSVDNDRFAVEQLLIEPKPAPITRTLKRTFDGQSGRQLLTVDFSETPIGQIEHGFPEFYVQGADIRPALLALCPMEPRLGRIDPAKCRVLPYRGKIDSISCTILMSGEPGNDQVFYWLDSDRDYIVLRELRMADGRKCSRTEISYRADPKFGWIPTGWKEATVDERGGFDDLLTSKVTELAINEPLPESTFRLVFPKGAEINDVPNQRRINAAPRIQKNAIRKSD